MRIQLHPDGTVYIHDDANDMIYCAAPAVFQAELRASLPALPEGMVRFAYDSETQILVHYDAKGNAFPFEGATPPPACLQPVLADTVQAIVQIEAARVAVAEDVKPAPVTPPATIPVAR